MTDMFCSDNNPETFILLFEKPHTLRVWPCFRFAIEAPYAHTTRIEERIASQNENPIWKPVRCGTIATQRIQARVIRTPAPKTCPFKQL